MDKTIGTSNEKEQEHQNRQSIIEAMIPAGLAGQIRDKARDALMTATVILGMGRTDILDHIQELAKENGLTPQSARAWLLFSKEMQDQAQSVGREVGGKGSQRTFSHGLGYNRGDAGTIGLDAVFRREVTGIGAGKKGNAGDDMRVELNREAGHHGDSIQGRRGAFSYDQMVDGWGAGMGSQGAGAVGLDIDVGLDMETENEYGSDGAQLDLDEHERLPGDSVMMPGDLHGVQLVGGGMRGASGHEIDSRDVFSAGKGGLSGGFFKASQQLDPRAAAMERAEAAVAGLNRKVGGFRGTDEEFAAFAKANPDLDRNKLRLIRKGMSDKDYLGWRGYSENGHLLGNRGHSDGRIATQTKACLLMASEDSARRFQNELRAKIRLFARIPDPGVEKLSIEHLERMQKSLPRLMEEHRVRVEAKAIQKAGKNRDEPDLER
jgi:hypothetical protein